MNTSTEPKVFNETMTMADCDQQYADKKTAERLVLSWLKNDPAIQLGCEEAMECLIGMITGMVTRARFGYDLIEAKEKELAEMNEANVCAAMKLVDELQGGETWSALTHQAQVAVVTTLAAGRSHKVGRFIDDIRHRLAQPGLLERIVEAVQAGEIHAPRAVVLINEGVDSESTEPGVISTARAASEVRSPVHTEHVASDGAIDFVYSGYLAALSDAFHYLKGGERDFQARKLDSLHTLLASEPLFTRADTYASEMGAAAEKYHDGFKNAHPLPAQWRWEEVWNAMVEARQSTQSHVLYEKGDADAPDCIKDCNGDIVLGLCKRCGKGEAELVEPCVPRGS